jgi:hypothetical protein
MTSDHAPKKTFLDSLPQEIRKQIEEENAERERSRKKFKV